MAKKQPSLAEYLDRILNESKETIIGIGKRARERGYPISEAYLHDLLRGRKDPDHMSIRTLKTLAFALNRPLPELLVACGLLPAESMLWRVPTVAPDEPERQPAKETSKTKTPPKRRRKRKPKPEKIYVILEEPPRKPIGFVPQKKRDSVQIAKKKLK